VDRAVAAHGDQRVRAAPDGLARPVLGRGRVGRLDDRRVGAAGAQPFEDLVQAGPAAAAPGRGVGDDRDGGYGTSLSA
jgi:hypothetical protein